MGKSNVVTFLPPSFRSSDVVFRCVWWDMFGPRRWTTRREPTSSLKTVQRLRPEAGEDPSNSQKTLRKWRWTWWTWWKWSSLKMDMFCHGRGCFGRTWAPTTFSPAWPCCCIGRFWWTLPSLATKHDRSFFSDHQVLEIRHQQIETNRNKSKIPGDLPFFDFWRSLWVILWYIYQSIWVYLHIYLLCSAVFRSSPCACLPLSWCALTPFLSEIWGLGKAWPKWLNDAKWLNSPRLPMTHNGSIESIDCKSLGS